MTLQYGRHSINSDDISSVLDVLKSDFLTQGPKVPYFESALSEYVSSKYTVAVNSATSALHIAYLALGLSENDLIITSPNTFVATSNAALMCGAAVEFVDINPNTLNMCPIALENKLKLLKSQNKAPKIVVPVHFSGQSCEMKRIHELSIEYSFRIVEDASHAIGGSYCNSKIGSCRYSDATVFSFHPVKIITTGEGGAVTTNSLSLYKKMQLFRSHGVTRDASLHKDTDISAWEYRQISLGYNYRQSDIHAALGISQLQRLDDFILLRNKLASNYSEIFSSSSFIPIRVIEDCISSWHLYVIQLPHEYWSFKSQIFERMKKKGINLNVHYQPVHTQPHYRFTNNTSLLNSENYYASALTLPLHCGITRSDQEYVASQLVDSIKQSCK